MLDLVAAILSGGLATHEVPPRSEEETNLSQVFIAVDAASPSSASIADQIIEHLGVRYPGGRTLETRRRNLEEGTPVDPSVWEFVKRV